MAIAIILTIIVCVIGAILTLVEVGKKDENYGKESKRNVTRLTVIYVIATILSTIALAIYIVNL
jgi:uncharacterized membrane protein YhaH (DUF805 family)